MVAYAKKSRLARWFSRLSSGPARRLKRMTRATRRYARRNPATSLVLVAGFITLGFVVADRRMEAPRTVNPAAYVTLLDTIAKGESNGNYNAYYGNANNDTVRFTKMTIAEVMQWQEAHVAQGNPSSAVGKYQIVRPTLAGLVARHNIDTQLKYDALMQDRLAIALLERRGSLEFIEKQLSRQEFAANLAKEWAALPKVVGANPQDSFYAGDGLNQSRISVAEVYAALQVLEETSKL